MGIKFLVIFIIVLRNVQGRTVCYEVADDSSETKSAPSISTQDDSIDVSDMLLTKKQYDALFSTNSMKRHGLTNTFRHWPNATVPVKFDKNFDLTLKERVKGAMRHIMNRSCIKFDWVNEPTSNYVYFTTAKRCASHVGNLRIGKQIVYLYKKCSLGNIIHELLHALGFLHMHTAVERDEYVDINWNNIMDKAKLNFKKYTTHVSMFGTDYDYDSIMHYNAKSFAKNRKYETIIKKKPGGLKMGQRKAMSEGDVIRLNRMYKCALSNLNKPESSTEMIIEDEADDEESEKLSDEEAFNDEMNDE